MKRLENLKIGTQLRIGLGTILAFALALGALAWGQAGLLWEDTRDLYHHPLLVRRAVGELKADVLSMTQDMHEVCDSENEPERQAALQRIGAHEADAQRRFEILFDDYLGPRSDVEDAQRTFLQWKSIRAETLRLLYTGDAVEAARRTRFDGTSGAHVGQLLSDLRQISDFAQAKGDELYLTATQRKEALNVQLGIVLGIIVLLSLGVTALLLKGIKDPLQELTAVADDFARGKLDARSAYASASELGTLAAAFNTLAEATQRDLLSRQQMADLNATMLRVLEAGEFGERVLQALMRATGSQVGAIYLLDEQRMTYELLESIGLGGAARAAFSAADHEGELGAALASGKLQRIANIPADTSFTFATVSGDFRPKEILTLPLRSGSETSAIISLASVRSYDHATLKLMEDLQAPLTTWMNSMLANRRLKAITAKLEEQNNELDAQKSELGRQNAELEQQKHQLDQANRLKTTFLSNMSHELRTPLNSVIALSGVLRRRLRETIPEEEHGYLAVIERNGKHLLALINDVLDLARIEAGREELMIERFSVEELARELVAMIEPLAREKNLEVVSSVSGDLPLLESDRAKCCHVLQNLLGNAVKFTEAGRVEISASASARSVVITVADTGIGIPADRLELIFEEFRQADESTARTYGGTGLGLSIAKNYAVLLGGSIQVTSTPGEGSTFALTLPLAAASVTTAESTRRAPPTAATTLGHGVDTLAATLSPEPEMSEPEMSEPIASAAASAAPIAAVQPLKSYHPSRREKALVLIVEDNPDNRLTARAVLADHYDVIEAQDGSAGLGRASAHLPDLVLMDLSMPLIDGVEALKAMRGEVSLRHIPVIALTASAMKGNREQILAHGFDGYVTKPIQAQVLLRTIAEVLDARA